jgi:hypothetical protein
MANHHRTSVKTSPRFDVTAEDAVLQALERGSHDLLVMGGDDFSFGDAANKPAQRSQMLVSVHCTAGAMMATVRGLADAPRPSSVWKWLNTSGTLDRRNVTIVFRREN